MGNRTLTTAAAATLIAAATLATLADRAARNAPPPTYSPLCTYDRAGQILACDGTPTTPLTLTVAGQTIPATVAPIIAAARWTSPPITPPTTLTLTAPAGHITYTIPAITANITGSLAGPTRTIHITASTPITTATAIRYDRPNPAGPALATHTPLTLPATITITVYPTTTLIVETYYLMVTRHPARIHTLIFPLVLR